MGKRCAAECHCSKECLLGWFRKNKLLIATIIGVLTGITLGIVLRVAGIPSDQIWLSIWGELFLRMLKFIVLPLVISCLVTGISSMKGTSSGKLGAVTFTYIIATQVVSVALAAVCTLAINPGGRWASKEFVNGTMNSTEEAEIVYYNDILTDFMRNLFPDNFIRACFQNTYTYRKNVTVYDNGDVKSEAVTSIKHRDGTNMIGIIMFSIALGCSISAAGKQGTTLLNIFRSLSKVIFILMNVIIWYSPFAIVSLIATSILQITDLSSVLTSIALYIVTFLVIAIIHHFILMPVIYLALLRKNPYAYYRYLLDGILAGFGPPSSAGGLPVLLNSCKDKLGIDPRIADFVLPIEAMMNRDGSAMYVVVAALYIAQTMNISVGFGNIVVLCLLSAFMASAIPPLPSASVMLLLTVTSAINVPLGDRLSVLMALEWIMDRVRTTNNLVSSGYGCAIIEKLCKNSLKTVVDIEDEESATAAAADDDNKASHGLLNSEEADSAL